MNREHQIDEIKHISPSIQPDLVVVDQFERPKTLENAVGLAGEYLAQMMLEHRGILTRAGTKSEMLGQFILHAMKDIRNVSPVPDNQLLAHSLSNAKIYPPDFIVVKDVGDVYEVAAIVEVKIRKPDVDSSFEVDKIASAESFGIYRNKLIYATFAKEIAEIEHAASSKTDQKKEFSEQLHLARELLASVTSHINRTRLQKDSFEFEAQHLQQPDIDDVFATIKQPPLSPIELTEDALGFSLDKPLAIAKDFKILYVTASDQNTAKLPDGVVHMPLPFTHQQIVEDVVPTLFPINTDRVTGKQVSTAERVEEILTAVSEEIIPTLRKVFDTKFDANTDFGVEQLYISSLLGRQVGEEEFAEIRRGMKLPPFIDTVWSVARRISSLTNSKVLDDRLEFIAGSENRLSQNATNEMLAAFNFYKLTAREIMLSYCF